MFTQKKKLIGNVPTNFLYTSLKIENLLICNWESEQKTQV